MHDRLPVLSQPPVVVVFVTENGAFRMRPQEKPWGLPLRFRRAMLLPGLYPDSVLLFGLSDKSCITGFCTVECLGLLAVWCNF